MSEIVAVDCIDETTDSLAQDNRNHDSLPRFQIMRGVEDQSRPTHVYQMQYLCKWVVLLHLLFDLTVLSLLNHV